MKNKLSLFINLNAEDKPWIVNLINNKKKSITNQQLIILLDITLFTILQKEGWTNITIFVLNLKYFKEYILKLIPYGEIQSFSFKNVLYSLKYKNALYKNKRIIIKDIAHFVHHTEPTKILDYIDTLRKLADKILINFDVDIFNFKILSLTSLSRTLFNKISPEKYKLISSLNQKEDLFIRLSFYGGRNEIIKPLFDNAYFYDINSLYPFIMSNNDLPIGKPNYIKTVVFNEHFYGFLDVLISCPTNIRLPILPIKSKELHSELGILYPTGSWRGVYFSEELRLALTHGYKIIKIYDGYSFKKDRIFDSYMNRIYCLRKEEKDINLNRIYKILMNCLYGRYASIYESIKTISYDENIQILHKKYENVAIASAISALGRMFMYNFVHNYQLNLYYWDTDSILIENSLKFNVGTDLGQFKLVANISKGICLSTKFYIYQTEKNYKYILRSIPQNKYDLNNSFIYEQFLKIITKTDLSSFEFNVTLKLKLLKRNEWEEVNFCFHNKRKYCLNNIIETIPWTIEAI